MSDKILVGVIGGSGLYHLDNLTFVKHLNPETPWGYPSAPITVSSLPSGAKIAFLPRHGSSHSHSPTNVPSLANIASLKAIGVRSIIAFSAVGSLREEIAPGDFVLPNQIIDRTKGIRKSTFFEGTGVVAHASFGDPFTNPLIDFLETHIRTALQGKGVKLHTGKCIICMEGPQFSTRAESLMYRAWGGDLINMSVLPEAKLAREAELGYALVATATDYDSWRPHTSSVTASEVFKTLKQNADTSRHVAAYVLEELVKAEYEKLLGVEEGGMKYSIMPANGAGEEEEGKKKLRYILPGYF